MISATAREHRVQALYRGVSKRLGVISPPPLQVTPIDPNKSAVFFRDENRIAVQPEYALDTAHRPPALRATLAHELAHVCLHRDGYHCIGHSEVFLAVERHALILVGVRGRAFTVRAGIRRNWPVRTPWRIRRAHLRGAYRLSRSAALAGAAPMSLPDFASAVHRQVAHGPIGVLRDDWHALLTDRGGLKHLGPLAGKLALVAIAAWGLIRNLIH